LFRVTRNKPFPFDMRHEIATLPLVARNDDVMAFNVVALMFFWRD
jgi:hypothetical protein